MEYSCRSATKWSISGKAALHATNHPNLQAGYSQSTPFCACYRADAKQSSSIIAPEIRALLCDALRSSAGPADAPKGCCRVLRQLPMLREEQPPFPEHCSSCRASARPAMALHPLPRASHAPCRICAGSCLRAVPRGCCIVRAGPRREHRARARLCTALLPARACARGGRGRTGRGPQGRARSPRAPELGGRSEETWRHRVAHGDGWSGTRPTTLGASQLPRARAAARAKAVQGGGGGPPWPWAQFSYAPRGSLAVGSDAGKVGAVAVGVVVGRLAGPVSLVPEQHRRWALQRRVAHPTVVLPVILWEDGNTRRTLVADAQGDASYAPRASCDHVVEAAETNHAAVVCPERTPRNWVAVVHDQYAELLGGLVEGDGGVQLGLYEVACGSARAGRWRRYAHWPPASHRLLHLLKSCEPFSGLWFSHSWVFYWGLLPRWGCEGHHGSSWPSPCVPWIWPSFWHLKRCSFVRAVS